MPDFLSFRLPESFIDQYRERPPTWGFSIGGGNSLSELTFIAKYSRKKADGTKEQWYEVCERATNGTYSILKDWCRQQRTPWNEFKALKSAQDFYERLFVFKWTPPGRGLWTMGTDLVHGEQHSNGLQNCSHLSTAKISTHSAWEATGPFVRIMEQAMWGIGVGSDTRGAGKTTLHQPTDKIEVLNVPDSREGWAESVGKLLESYFFKNRPHLKINYDLIRPAGQPLKRFGGFSSGPNPLIQCHDSIRQQLEGREGDLLTSRDITDIINKIGKAVQAGGSRRSAQLMLGSPDDKDYVNIKNWELAENAERTGPDGWAWGSNNTVIAEVGTEYSDLVDKITINGEPGLFWLELARSYGRLVDSPDGKDWRATGTNPCSFASETIVMTTDGPQRIDSLEGKPFWALVDGEAYLSPNGAWITGEDDIYTLRTTEGYEVNLTGNHRVMQADGQWCEARNLVPGDAVKIHNHRAVPPHWAGNGTGQEGYLLGLFLGDGSFQADNAILNVWEKDEGHEGVLLAASEAMMTLKRRSDFLGWRQNSTTRPYAMSIPKHLCARYGFSKGTKHITEAIELSSAAFHQGFLRGVFDADGHLEGYRPDQDQGVSIRLGQSNWHDLQAIQRMLLRLGIKGRIYQAREEGLSMLPDGRGGIAPYKTKKSWRLVISSNDVTIFAERVGFNNEAKATKLAKAISIRTKGFYSKPFVATVTDLEFLRRDTVWDLTVSTKHAFDANGLYVSNSEQTLEDSEVCTLVEMFPSHHETFEDFKQTIKAAYLYGKAVTLLPTTWPETNEVMSRNRRIGCSMSGLAQFVEERGWMELKRWMDDAYGFIVHRDTKYSEWLAVRESIKKTSIKPSGTVSIVAGVTPGVHWPVKSGYYLRRIRYTVFDPVVKILAEAGYEVEPSYDDPLNTVVVAFPTCGPVMRDERNVSIWEKTELAVLAQRYWADNQVSATISFMPHETEQVPHVLSAKDGQLKSISFLPITDNGTFYRQAPYEPLDAAVAVAMMAKIKPLPLDKLYSRNSLEAQGEKYCSNDVCML